MRARKSINNNNNRRNDIFYRIECFVVVVGSLRFYFIVALYKTNLDYQYHQYPLDLNTFSILCPTHTHTHTYIDTYTQFSFQS